MTCLEHLRFSKSIFSTEAFGIETLADRNSEIEEKLYLENKLRTLFYLLAIKLITEVFNRNHYHSHLGLMKYNREVENLDDFYSFCLYWPTEHTNKQISTQKLTRQRKDLANCLNTYFKPELVRYMLPLSSEAYLNDVAYILTICIPGLFASSYLDLVSLLTRLKELLKISVLDTHLAKNEQRKTELMKPWQKKKVREEVIPIFLEILEILQKLAARQMDQKSYRLYNKKILAYRKLLQDYLKAFNCPNT